VLVQGSQALELRTWATLAAVAPLFPTALLPDVSLTLNSKGMRSSQSPEPGTLWKPLSHPSQLLHRVPLEDLQKLPSLMAPALVSVSDH